MNSLDHNKEAKLKRKRLISIVLPSLEVGGAELSNWQLAEEFLALGYAVELVTIHPPGTDDLQPPEGATLVCLGQDRLIKSVVPLVRYFRLAKPDFILAAMWPLTIICIFSQLVGARNARIVVSEHIDFRYATKHSGMAKFFNKHLARFIYSRSDAVVAVSKGVAESLTKCVSIPVRKISVIYNPIRDRALSYQEFADDGLLKWWHSGDHKIVTIGKLKAQKNQKLMLDSMKLVKEHRDIRLLILGDGPLRRELECQVEETGLKTVVRMPGIRSDPYPYLLKADLFVLSSDFEGLGNVITEALSCGVPVVSTDCPSGPAEILEDGRFGILVPVRDKDALASAVITSLDGDHDAEALKARAAEFNPKSAALQYLALWNKPARI